MPPGDTSPDLEDDVFEAWPYQGTTGVVVVDIGARRGSPCTAEGRGRLLDPAGFHRSACRQHSGDPCAHVPHCRRNRLALSAAGGYTTELLARSIGPTGKVYGQSRPRDPNPAPANAAAPEGNPRPNLAPGTAPAASQAAPRPSPAALAEREARLREAGIPAAPIVALSRPFEDPVPPDLASDQFDLVTLMFNYHDLGHLGVDRARMNTAVFRALKPGGLFVIADHAGRRGTGISESGTNPS